MLFAMAGGFAVTAGAGALVLIQKHKVGAGILVAVGILTMIVLSATRAVELRGPFAEGLLTGLPVMIAAMFWLERRRRREEQVAPGV